jgi:3-deoxy-D-arabino-heptulosonate 7-phosphate (DAHP) synthase
MVVSAGADGLMIESHYNPAEALVDGPQMVTPDELKDIIDACKTLYRTKKRLVSTRRG